MNETSASLAAQSADLGHLPMAELWVLWDRYFERRPNHPNRTHVESRVAYKLRAKPRTFSFAPGTVLLREWGEHERRVTVNADGHIEYEGYRFKSLRAVARHITGPQWSGPPVLRPEGRCLMVEIASPKARKRCAVYCRVSSDERLHQEFNSIDAQREAGHAIIASQRAEGWIPVADDYDDPGYSGGNTERPAVKRQLADIQVRRIDIVVVCKIDRLTRSLADFSKMVEVFERHGVSFVSVTQQFNTASSMGRPTLNILLSFAQFEREVTGERIRDKIAAAKKKGKKKGQARTVGLG